MMRFFADVSKLLMIRSDEAAHCEVVCGTIYWITMKTSGPKDVERYELDYQAPVVAIKKQDRSKDRSEVLGKAAVNERVSVTQARMSAHVCPQHNLLHDRQMVSRPRSLNFGAQGMSCTVMSMRVS